MNPVSQRGDLARSSAERMGRRKFSGGSVRTAACSIKYPKLRALEETSVTASANAIRIAGTDYRPRRCVTCVKGLGSFVPARKVLGLLLGQLVDVDPHRRELEPGDLAVDLVRHRIDLPLE